MVAHSVKMRAFLSTLEQGALAEATVLVEGETGVGKELAAAALHALSPRRAGPFVTFDCGAVLPTLAAAELFGFEKGAFSGAGAARAGLIEEARGGTLFIDEIGELPLELQPLLLRAIESKRSRRIGGKGEITNDVRIVAATNRNLSEEVRAGRFRQDLFFRVAVLRLRVPPLRERREDIPFLADQFAREAGGRFAPEALAPFSTYDWPGNVRELKNTLIRMLVRPQEPPAQVVVASRSRVLFGEDGELRPWLEAARLARLEVEREYVHEVFARAGGNLKRAAALAGVTHQSLAVLLEKHGVRRRGE
jgi:DNA-binding NtrC family response regulator